MDDGRVRGHADGALAAISQRIVTLGGGTGPFALLSHLKHYPCTITAIVTMADSGGSSRRLMDEFGQLPLGDLRQALTALSRRGVLWRELFTHRFDRRTAASDLAASLAGNGSGPATLSAVGVSGHSLGNLILAGLEQINGGNLLHALRDAEELLDTAGRVLPVSLGRTDLCAELSTGEVIRGETEIDTRGERELGPLPAITRVFLDPPVDACEDALRALRRADLIIIGPGDLYTSILPNLLVDGVADAIRASSAEKVYVCNLMTKHGETDGFRASDFVREVHRYLGGRVDRVVVHDGSLPLSVVDAYAAQHQEPVAPDVAQLEQLVPHVVVEDLAAMHARHLTRHDPDRLLRAILMPRFGRVGASTPATVGSAARPGA